MRLQRTIRHVCAIINVIVDLSCAVRSRLAHRRRHLELGRCRRPRLLGTDAVGGWSPRSSGRVRRNPGLRPARPDSWTRDPINLSILSQLGEVAWSRRGRSSVRNSPHGCLGSYRIDRPDPGLEPRIPRGRFSSRPRNGDRPADVLAAVRRTRGAASSTWSDRASADVCRVRHKYRYLNGKPRQFALRKNKTRLTAVSNLG